MFLLCIVFINYIVYIFIAEPVLYDDYYPSINELNKYKCFLLSDSHGESVEKKDLSEVGIYNFAFDSDSYIDMMLKLNYLNNNAAPETIFLSVDDHTLSPYRENMNNRSRSIRFCDWSLYKQFYGQGYLSYIFEKYCYPYLPLLNTNNSKLFYSFLTSFFKVKNLEEDGTSQFADLSYEQKIKSSMNRMQYQFPQDNNDKNLNLFKEALLQMISLCRKNNITLIGVKFPLAKNYIEVLGDKSYDADTFAKKQEVKVIDLKSIFIGRDHLFSNPDHLNKIGSKEFVFQLAKKCNANNILCVVRNP